MLLIFDFLDAELIDKERRAAKFKKFSNLAIPILVLFSLFNIYMAPAILGNYIILLLLIGVFVAINYFNRVTPMESIIKKYSKDVSAINSDDYDALAEMVKNSSSLKETIQKHCEDRKTFTISDAVWLWSESKKNPGLIQTSSQNAIFG